MRRGDRDCETRPPGGGGGGGGGGEAIEGERHVRAHRLTHVFIVWSRPVDPLGVGAAPFCPLGHSATAQTARRSLLLRHGSSSNGPAVIPLSLAHWVGKDEWGASGGPGGARRSTSYVTRPTFSLYQCTPAPNAGLKELTVLDPAWSLKVTRDHDTKKNVKYLTSTVSPARIGQSLPGYVALQRSVPKVTPAPTFTFAMSKCPVHTRGLVKSPGRRMPLRVAPERRILGLSGALAGGRRAVRVELHPSLPRRADGTARTSGAPATTRGVRRPERTYGREY